MNLRIKEENKEFLTTQIITYLGNKRALIQSIEKEVEAIASDLKMDIPNAMNKHTHNI